MKQAAVNFQPVAEFGKSVVRTAKTITIVTGLLAIGFVGGSAYHTRISLPVTFQVSSAAEDEAQQRQLLKVEDAVADTVKPAHKPKIPVPVHP